MRHAFVVLLIATALAACAGAPPGAAREEPFVPVLSPEARAADQLFEDWFEARLRLNPLLATSIGDPRYDDRYEVSISPDWRARAERLARDSLEAARGLDAARLDAARRLSLEMFVRSRTLELDGLRYPSHLLPLDQFNSAANEFAQLGAGTGLHPFRTVADYDNFLKRSDGFVAWVDQAIANMRLGIAEGIVQPRVLMERVIPQLEAQLADDPERSVFWGPVRSFPADISPAERERLTAEWRRLITGRLEPAYARLRDFVRDEYLPRCRDTVGLVALPRGRDWYAHRVRLMTTTDDSPEGIHSLGLAEVTRIRAGIEAVMRRVGFGGDLAAFLDFVQADPRFFWETPGQLIAGYVEIKQRVAARLPRLFERLPQADYEVRAVEPFRARSAAGGSYQPPSADGRRPGVFYANTYDLRARPKWGMEALSLHEGSPGHHFQIALQREQQAVPRFRRFSGETAFSEGWALYAESLGPELGMYEDPYQYFGMLEAELFRAVRLVVDTGLHAKGWTRAQAIDYMNANTAAAEARTTAEIERYIAMPAQALAYKVGQLKFLELRSRAERALGARFDVRRFHTLAIGEGPMPLDILEARVDRWIAADAGR